MARVLLCTVVLFAKCNWSKFNVSSNYLNSPWCVEEFLVAHERTTRDKDYLIPVLIEDLHKEEVAKHPEIELYIKTHTYIDARNLQYDHPNIDRKIETFRKRIR